MTQKDWQMLLSLIRQIVADSESKEKALEKIDALIREASSKQCKKGLSLSYLLLNYNMKANQKKQFNSVQKEVKTIDKKLKKSAYDIQYAKSNIKRVYFNLNKKNDIEIIEKLESVPNKQAYIKALIKKDIGK